jgi:anaerobic magnesium-protoporphyrin IX monomethyl ester cyclase
MNVGVLVARPDRPMDFLQQPVEALYTTTILEQRGHDATLLDLRISDARIEIDNPDLFVLITQTYDLTQCYSISLENSARTVAELRERFPGVPVVAAGLHPSLRPEMTVREIGCDQALPGEIEVAVPWLVDRFAADPAVLERPLLDAPRTVDPADLPVPDYRRIDVASYWSEIVDPASETVSRGTTGLLFANRGCPYTCTY